MLMERVVEASSGTCNWPFGINAHDSRDVIDSSYGAFSTWRTENVAFANRSHELTSWMEQLITTELQESDFRFTRKKTKVIIVETTIENCSSVDFAICSCPRRYAYLLETVFTALHGMQTQRSDEKVVCLSLRPSVRLSIYLSVCQTRELWQNGKKICPDFYTVRKII